MTVLLVLAFLAAAVIAGLAYLDRTAARDRARLADLRRTVRIAADRDLVYGRRPLPPGVTLEAALRRQSATGDTLAEAATDLYVEQTRARIAKSLRRPRPGD